MRTTKELLKIMLINISKLKMGLCGLVWQLAINGTINHDEADKLSEYIQNYRPFNLHSMIQSPYYWKPGAIKPRKKWLNSRIKKQN